MNRAQRRKAEKAIRRLVTDRCSHHSTEETDAVVDRCLAGLSEIVRAAGVSSETWLNVQSSPWKRDDAEWFKAHPQRAHRVREQFPGEQLDLANSRPVDIVIVRQIQAGLRARAPFTVIECDANSQLALARLLERGKREEAVAHVLFELTQQKGRLLQMSEIMEMVARYETAPSAAGMN